jgi:hypothetical protein
LGPVQGRGAPAPVTAKFSKEFYDKLGRKVADELVDWFNKADATYRTDLREINELNVARFDAKVEQRFAEQDARWERRLAQLDAKWESRLAQQDAKWDGRLADFRTEMHQAMSHLEVRLIRWMLGLWIASLGTTMTLLKLWVG